jgi:hypothetical protein
MIDYFAVILSSNSRKDCAFCLRDSESLECVFDIFWYFVPAFSFTLFLGSRKITNLLKIECAEVWSPCRNGFDTIDFESFQSELEHPRWLVIVGRNSPNHFFIESRS